MQILHLHDLSIAFPHLSLIFVCNFEDAQEPAPHWPHWEVAVADIYFLVKKNQAAPKFFNGSQMVLCVKPDLPSCTRTCNRILISCVILRSFSCACCVLSYVFLYKSILCASTYIATNVHKPAGEFNVLFCWPSGCRSISNQIFWQKNW